MPLTMLATSFFLGFLCACALYERELKRQSEEMRRAAEVKFQSFFPRIPSRGWIDFCDAASSYGAVRGAQSDASRDQAEDFWRGLSALSHDMRTPLTGAKGYVQLAQGEESAEKSGRHLAAAVRRLDEVEELLDQLSDYSRANDPDRTYTVASIALLPALLEVLGGYELRFSEKGWIPTIDFDDEAVSVCGDPSALQRVLDNIVSNAFRYGVGAPRFTQRGTASSWSLEIANPVGDASALDAGKLFERTWRGDPARHGRGLGLGLSIARSLAGDMGMSLDAVVGNGEVALILSGGEKRKAE